MHMSYIPSNGGGAAREYTHSTCILSWHPSAGTANDIDVIVSRDNKDIIYEMDFSVELQNPVALNITYTNEDGETDSRIPDIAYNNTRRITYREIPGQLPFDVYYVSIALLGVNGSQLITGPPTTSPEKIGRYMQGMRSYVDGS